MTSVKSVLQSSEPGKTLAIEEIFITLIPVELLVVSCTDLEVKTNKSIFINFSLFVT